eukprot:scaffold1957_cov110-Isochrysis_galbana.AAC.18
MSSIPIESSNGAADGAATRSVEASCPRAQSGALATDAAAAWVGRVHGPAGARATMDGTWDGTRPPGSVDATCAELLASVAGRIDAAPDDDRPGSGGGGRVGWGGGGAGGGSGGGARYAMGEGVNACDSPDSCFPVNATDRPAAFAPPDIPAHSPPTICPWAAQPQVASTPASSPLPVPDPISAMAATGPADARAALAVPCPSPPPACASDSSGTGACPSVSTFSVGPSLASATTSADSATRPVASSSSPIGIPACACRSLSSASASSPSSSPSSTADSLGAHGCAISCCMKPASHSSDASSSHASPAPSSSTPRSSSSPCSPSFPSASPSTRSSPSPHTSSPSAPSPSIAPPSHPEPPSTFMPSAPAASRRVGARSPAPCQCSFRTAARDISSTVLASAGCAADANAACFGSFAPNGSGSGSRSRSGSGSGSRPSSRSGGASGSGPASGSGSGSGSRSSAGVAGGDAHAGRASVRGVSIGSSRSVGGCATGGLGVVGPATVGRPAAAAVLRRRYSAIKSLASGTPKLESAATDLASAAPGLASAAPVSSWPCSGLARGPLDSAANSGVAPTVDSSAHTSKRAALASAGVSTWRGWAERDDAHTKKSPPCPMGTPGRTSGGGGGGFGGRVGWMGGRAVTGRRVGAEGWAWGRAGGAPRAAVIADPGAGRLGGAGFLRLGCGLP